jgi:TP901-1 family phage major tail protein
MSTVVTSPNGCVAGARLLVSLNYGGFQVLAGQRGGRLSMSANTIDVSSKDSNYWNEALPGYRGWTMSADGCVVNDDIGHIALWSTYANNVSVTIRMVTPTGKALWGNAFITSLDYEGGHDGAFMFSVNFQGSYKLYGDI